MVDNKEKVIPTPAWFARKAKDADIMSLDADIQKAYASFRDKYAPEKWENLRGDDLLSFFCIGYKDDSLCHALEFNRNYRVFGTISGGSSWAYYVFRSRDDAQWKTSLEGRTPLQNGMRIIDMEESAELLVGVRHAVVQGAEKIKSFGEPKNSIEYAEWSKMLRELNIKLGKDIAPNFVTRAWVLKYYHMLYPNIIPCWYSDKWINYVSQTLKLPERKDYFEKMGEIMLYVKKTNLSVALFSEIFQEQFGKPDAQKWPPELENEVKPSSNFSKNRIIFGAPGTGKSYKLEQERNDLLANGGDYERVTFHPDYSYANFVGTYKPVMVKDGSVCQLDDKQKHILSVLKDDEKTAQQKYDSLYNLFKDDNLTRLPLLLGLYSDDSFKTRKADGSNTTNNNDVERNHGKAIRPFVKLYCDSSDGKKEIAYKYVPGPFLRVLVKALKDKEKPYLLIIEEINRANIAAVFGDVFQLLDRNEDGESEFAIATSEDIRAYLAEALGVDESEVKSIRIPNNMYIWATMNSADQGVYPMDTAFKRRWEFEYLSIDAKESAIEDLTFKDARSDSPYSWNKLRKAINDKLIELKVNEDKLLGPFFLKRADFDNDDKFKAVFKSKVLMYLFEDAARHRRSELFKGCGDKDCNIFSRICDRFGECGMEIFCPEIADKFPVTKPEEQQEQ